MARAAAGGPRDLRDQPLQSHPRAVPHGARGPRATVAAAVRAFDAARGARERREARPLLGHARLAAGRAHGRRRARRRSSRRCAARRDATFASDADIDAYVDGLGFAVAGTFGGHYVLRRDRDRRPGLRALRPRQRRAAVRAGGARAARSGRAADVSHLHVPRALGSHHGPAVLHAGLHPGQPHRHLRRPRGARGGAAPPAGPAVVSRGLRCAQGRHRVRAPRARRAPRRRRHDGDDDAAAARRRFVRLSLRAGRPHRRLHDRLRAQARATRRDAGFVEFFRDADLVVFDAMYSLADAISVKADWGHSSNIVGVELCQLAGAAHLCLFHHEPASDDAAIAACSPTRGASRRSRATARRCASPPPTTEWKSSCDAGRGPGSARASHRPHPPRGRRARRRAGAR